MIGLASRRPPRSASRPAEDRLDPEQELARAERLHDVVVGADLEADDAVDLLALRGEHDHRQRAIVSPSRRSRRQTSSAGDVREHDVEQDEVRAAGA